MVTRKLTLNLITPEKQLIKEKPVDMVILPALLGEMGVLPGHINMVVQLGMGSLRYKMDEKEEEFAVLGGFAEILHDEVNIFAESAALAGEIDEEKERQRIKALKESLSNKDADIDFELAELEIKQSIARMKVKKKHL